MYHNRCIAGIWLEYVMTRLLTVTSVTMISLTYWLYLIFPVKNISLSASLKRVRIFKRKNKENWNVNLNVFAHFFCIIRSKFSYDKHNRIKDLEKRQTCLKKSLKIYDQSNLNTASYILFYIINNNILLQIPEFFLKVFCCLIVLTIIL